MNIYVVFCKTRKKFDKYVKVNRIRNKIIIDIKNQLEEEDVEYQEYKDYFNILIYTKILHAFKKGKDIYYIPNFDNSNINVTEIFKLSKIMPSIKVDYNLLFFYDEFTKDDDINQSIIDNMDKFTVSQIIKDY